MLRRNDEMAETEELKRMALNFRVSELQVLLGYAGWNKHGRKTDLLQRALCQIEKGCSPRIAHKIKELSRTIHNPYATETTRNSRANTKAQQVVDARRRYAQGKTTPLSPSNTATAHATGPVDYTKGSSSIPTAHTGGSVIPVHPDVRFKRLAFYDIMGELLKPTSLVPRGPSRYQETYFVFHLTPQQAQDIAMSRDFRPSAKFEYTVQIQLRFCFLETSCEQDDNFPPSICVRVNGKMGQLPRSVVLKGLTLFPTNRPNPHADPAGLLGIVLTPELQNNQPACNARPKFYNLNPIPTTKPGVEPKRPGRPVDITSLCRISPTMPNHVEISWASEYGRGYCVSINLVKRLSSDILLQRLKQFGNRHADHTRALIKEKLQHDPECEVATTSLRISLVCPLGKMRMNLPCRAGSCTHIQCFDAVTFLMMNEKKPTWHCPVCDKPTPFHKLTIDGLFVEILKKVTDVDEIQFMEDGSWGPIRNTKDTLVINSPAVIKSHTIEDNNEVDLCGDSSMQSTSPAKKPKMDVIDLTLTDSEDEEPPRPESSHNISSGASTPRPDLSNTPVMIPSPASATSSSSNGVTILPPMPPLLNYKKTADSAKSAKLTNVPLNRATVPRILGNNSTNNSHSGSYSTPAKIEAYSPTDINQPSWLTALSGSGQKRPPPAHSNNLPPAKRIHLEKNRDSPASSNSNDSPLVDYDSLCNLLDSDRNEEMNSVLGFPADFPISGPISAASHSRNIFNISPSDVISLD